MPDFDVEAFVTELDRMGVKLTRLRLLTARSGNRRRMLNVADYARQIESLWIAQIGNDRHHISIVTAHLI